MIEIPFELWCLIVSFARRRDLLCLARVSPLFLKASRQALYREVRLSNSEYLQETLRLLQDPTMARMIAKFTIREIPSKRMDGDIPVDHILISTMSNLRSLSVLGCPNFFLTAKDQDMFVKNVSQSCPHLQEIRYRSHVEISSDDFAIANISRIEWSEKRGFTPPLISLCRASGSTITHLSVASNLVMSFHSIPSVVAFSKLSFPRLLSLELGPWQTRAYSQESSTAITKFLLSHPTIEHLHLAYRAEYDEFDDIIILDDGLITANMLPNLKSLDTHTLIMWKLAKHRATFWNTISTISISQGIAWDIFYWYNAMMESLWEPTGDVGLQNVRCMVLFLQDESWYGEVESIRSHSHFQMMLEAAAVFPRLEMWKGDTPADMTPSVFIDMFSKFRDLRVVDLTGWPSGFSNAEEDEIQRLSDCPRLEIIKSRLQGGVLSNVLSVSRDEEGRISLRHLDIDDYE